MSDTLVETVQKQTVQEFNPPESLGRDITSYFWYRAALLPPWGDASRARRLWDFYYDPYNWAIQGAFAAIAKQVASTPYEIKGDAEHKILTRHFERVLSGAEFDDFGGGFRGLISRVVLDFLRFDDGAFIEIIGGGDPRREIQGRVNGIAHLNALRCAATGYPETPVVYQTRRTGQLHYLHRSRIARLVDMPDGTDDETGRGLSALSRAISVAQSILYQTKYQIQRLDDLPPAGILSLTNAREQWDDAVLTYESQRKRDGGSVWANLMVLQSLDPTQKIEINHFPFASNSEHFDIRDYLEVMVVALALALNVDPQDIWPLTGAPLGTGTQSKILHSKAAGKMLGDIRTLITRVINFYVLPDSLEFQFKYKDPEQDKDTAETEAILANTASVLKSVIGDELAAQYLVNAAERFADVLLDDQGQLRLPSDDPKPDEILVADVPDDLTSDSETPSAAEATVPEDEITGDSETPFGQKDIQATRLDFEGDVEDALRAGAQNDVTRRRFGTVMRALIARYGRQAFTDGLEAGGVEDAPGDDDLSTIAGLVAQQSAYVTGLADTLFRDGLTEDQLAQKPALWWNKSIMPFYQAGVASADRNGMYEWALGATEEHCRDCLNLNGQKHRMKDWIRRGLLPQSNSLECGGFNCDCRLVRTTGRASGRF